VSGHVGMLLESDEMIALVGESARLKQIRQAQIPKALRQVNCAQVQKPCWNVAG